MKKRYKSEISVSEIWNGGISTPQNKSDMVKYKLRVTSCKLRVTSLELKA